MATHSSILVWKDSMDTRAWQAIGHDWAHTHFTCILDLLTLSHRPLRLFFQTFFFFSFIQYLFIYLAVLGLSCGMWNLVPWSRIEPGPRNWKCGVLATGLPGKSLLCPLFKLWGCSGKMTPASSQATGPPWVTSSTWLLPLPLLTIPQSLCLPHQPFALSSQTASQESHE